MKRLLLAALLSTCAFGAHAQTVTASPGCVFSVVCYAAGLLLPNGGYIGAGTNGFQSINFGGNSPVNPSVTIDATTSPDIGLRATGSYVWTADTVNSNDTPDTWIGRAAAGVVKVGKTAGGTDGTAQLALINFMGTIPVVTGTGTPTIVTGSTDSAGEVTGGTLATSIIVTFSSTKTNAPFCTVTSQTQLAAFAYTISTTAITITLTATTGEKVDYVCFQH